MYCIIYGFWLYVGMPKVRFFAVMGQKIAFFKWSPYSFQTPKMARHISSRKNDPLPWPRSFCKNIEISKDISDCQKKSLSESKKFVIICRYNDETYNDFFWTVPRKDSASRWRTLKPDMYVIELISRFFRAPFSKAMSMKLLVNHTYDIDFLTWITTFFDSQIFNIKTSCLGRFKH